MNTYDLMSRCWSLLFIHTSVEKHPIMQGSSFKFYGPPPPKPQGGFHPSRGRGVTCQWFIKSAAPTKSFGLIKGILPESRWHATRTQSWLGLSLGCLVSSIHPFPPLSCGFMHLLFSVDGQVFRRHTGISCFIRSRNHSLVQRG